MDSETAKKILRGVIESDIRNIEFTGGTPELNPNFRLLIEGLSGDNRKLAVRTSLTVLDMPEYSDFAELYREHNVKVIASLPGTLKEATDRQRGEGVFDSSIRVLRRLNTLGYGDSGLSLDFVYNPLGDYLPPDQTELEREYRQLLDEEHDISFNNLVTIVNSPIKRFKNYLIKEGLLESYLKKLMNNFNYETLDNLMCRHLISVDHQGYLYDCDFNLALGIRVKGYEDNKFWEIDFESFYPEVTCDVHCYSCTVNRGSSCHGVLTENGQENKIRDNVKQYYGMELQSSEDLKTTACCPLDTMPEEIREVLPYIAEEIKTRYYGCGSPIPSLLKGLTILDLGCGTGRDSYVLSRLVGEDGHIYGIDMTEAQIAVARKYLDEQTARFGYSKPNLTFIHDYIENTAAHIPRSSLDIAVSNCVINLVEDKESILREVYRMLKTGGELYFSDIYVDRRLPGEIRNDPVLYGECLGGALYRKDFERIAKKAGFIDPRIISEREVDITNKEIKALTGNARFYSITYRLWKLNGLDDDCEDYGHIAIYRGGLPESPFRFELDGGHLFEKNRPERVCGNTALMLSATRFGDYFEVIGNFDEHFGEFRDCATADDSQETPRGSSCDC